MSMIFWVLFNPGGKIGAWIRLVFALFNIASLGVINQFFSMAGEITGHKHITKTDFAMVNYLMSISWNTFKVWLFANIIFILLIYITKKLESPSLPKLPSLAEAETARLIGPSENESRPREIWWRSPRRSPDERNATGLSQPAEPRGAPPHEPL
jgi:hypothetical protein